jgi:Zn-dependent oligopeptidase
MCSQLKYAQNAETCQRAYESYEACLELNAPLLDNALKLCQGLAIGMEYESWVDYRIEWRMAESGDNIEEVCSI